MATPFRGTPPARTDSRTSYYLYGQSSLVQPPPGVTPAPPPGPGPPAPPSRGATPESGQPDPTGAARGPSQVVPGHPQGRAPVTPPPARRCGTTCAIPFHRRRRPSSGRRRDAAGNVGGPGGDRYPR